MYDILAAGTDKRGRAGHHALADELALVVA
jgi:hypothetical protein